ncbi:MAG: alginate lyase family protein [Candidatus Sumerlaeaceae bacterium]
MSAGLQAQEHSKGTEAPAQANGPRTFATAQQLERARARAKSRGWAREIIRRLLADCDSVLSSPINVPAKAGQWSHHYVCKDCGNKLANQKGRHVCPRCGSEYKGWPYDEVIAARQHTQNIDAIRDLGLAYALTSETRYAARARELLLAYADRYKLFPIHDYKGGQMQKGARIFAQTLDEATRAIGLVWGYDLVKSAAVISNADRQHIEQDLLRPLAATIERNPMGVSNWQSWHDAALTGIGYVLGDMSLVQKAVHGSDGAEFQLSKSVLPDGFWYEGSASYHFYALEALAWTMLADQANGGRMYLDPRFRSMFEAPLDYIFPDGRFPAVNDSDPVQLKSEQERYEMAYAWYGDPRFGVAAASGKRDTIAALLWGKDELPRTAPEPTRSRNFPGLGAVMLRQSSGTQQIVAHLDYGPHGGAHGHFDKLALILFANGHVVAPDPARVAYGSPLQASWYKTTLAHNALVVDGKNQEPCEGKLEFFKEQDGVSVARASTDAAYPGVKITRTTAVTARYVLDVVAAENTSAPMEHVFDLSWHFHGDASNTPRANLVAKSLGTTAGYQLLSNAQRADVPGTWSLDYTYENSTVRQTMLGADGSAPPEVYLAEGLADNPPTTCPMTLARHKGSSVCYVTLIQPLRTDGECTITRRNQKPGALELLISTPGGEDHWDMPGCGGNVLRYKGSAGTLSIN